MKLVRKLALLLNEKIPGRRVFFIYTHKNGYDRFHHGLKANTEISYFAYCALKNAFGRVTFLRLSGEKAKKINKITENDVVIGHTGETFEKASLRTKKLIHFAPFVGHEDHVISKGSHCSDRDVEMKFYKKAASSILLTSEYNQREYLETDRNFWYSFFKDQHYRVVHQPIDLNVFPRIKFDYKTHDFLYIGHYGHMKCVDDSIALVAKLGRKLHLFGCAKTRFNNLDKAQVASLPQIADFFIQPGMWEGQCVAILEAAARGFIPVVSKETGYPYDHPYLLKFGDFDYNCKVLKKLMNTSPEERKELGDYLHAKLANDPEHNSWKRLTDVLVEEVRAHFY